MTLTDLIDDDCRSLNRLFLKLFDLLREAIVEDQAAPLEASDIEASESQKTYHSFTHLIKPGMLIDIYGLIDFWMKEICKYQKGRGNLKLSYKDIKGEHDLDAYQKYLIKYAGLELGALQNSYEHLNNLREVRNLFIHSGGHVPSNKEKKFSAINGITIHGSLIVIEDSFIWDALDHAKKYLNAAAQA